MLAPPSLNTLSTLDPEITVSGVKARLLGLDNWLAAAAASSAKYDEAAIKRVIVQCLRDWSRKSLYRLTPSQVISDDDGAYTGTINDGNYTPGIGGQVSPDGLPVVHEAAYDYDSRLVQQFFRINLRLKPVLSIQRIRLKIGQLQITALPPEWYSLNAASGVVSILPTSGSAFFTGSSVAMTDLLMGYGSYGTIPNCIHCDYTCGLAPGWGTKEEYADLVLGLEQVCARQVLLDLADLRDAGTLSKSINVDGATQSINYDRFEGKIKRLEASIADFNRNWIDAETPIIMRVL